MKNQLYGTKRLRRNNFFFVNLANRIEKKITFNSIASIHLYKLSSDSFLKVLFNHSKHCLNIGLLVE